MKRPMTLTDVFAAALKQPELAESPTWSELAERRLKKFERVVDKVLAYKPKPKSKAAKKRKRRAAKLR